MGGSYERRREGGGGWRLRTLKYFLSQQHDFLSDCHRDDVQNDHEGEVLVELLIN